MELRTQQVGGVATSNYLPILAPDVNWEQLSYEEREATARYAVNAAIEQAQTDAVPNFTVMGMTADESDWVFLYTGGEALSLIENGEPITVSLAP
jgi:hypothetical protein